MDALRDAREPVVDGWWSALYGGDSGEDLADLLLDAADPRETEATVDFLIDALALPPGARVFDQCCGTGRLALPFARRGYAITGVELSAGYVARARSRIDDCLDVEGFVAPHLFVGDAFAFVPDPPCDGAFNWWTSFGYADDDATNQRMLARAFDALAPGGRFALDFHNSAAVLRHFREHVVDRRSTARGEIVMIRESRVDLARGRLEKRFSFLADDGRRAHHDSAVRLYFPADLARMLAAVGFVDVRFVGDVTPAAGGAPLGLDAPRCIAIARRPA